MIVVTEFHTYDFVIKRGALFVPDPVDSLWQVNEILRETQASPHTYNP